MLLKIRSDGPVNESWKTKKLAAFQRSREPFRQVFIQHLVSAIDFFNLGLSWTLFGFYFFLVNCLYYNWQILTMVMGNRKEGGRVCTVLFLVLKKKPSENRFAAILSQKNRPGIRTCLAQTECHCSTTCVSAIDNKGPEWPCQTCYKVFLDGICKA